MVKGITYILNENVAVQALVGRNKANTKYKNYPGVAPSQEETPYTVTRLASKPPLAECKGMFPKEFTPTYEVFVYTKSYDDTERLSNAVVRAIERVESAVVNGVSFEDIRYINERDQIVMVEGDSKVLYGKVITFEATINESITADSTEVTADSTIVYADES
jgi:hypothetical protein